MEIRDAPQLFVAGRSATGPLLEVLESRVVAASFIFTKCKQGISGHRVLCHCREAREGSLRFVKTVLLIKQRTQGPPTLSRRRTCLHRSLVQPDGVGKTFSSSRFVCLFH